MAGNRSIFEEVEATARTAATPGALSRDRSGPRRRTRAFLIVLFALVTVMIAVGGLTRLTDSGLSITVWEPIAGAIPPLTEAEWEAELEAYRATSEYQQQNRGMTMAEFRVIFWWEWGHRQLGRVIGLVWAVGLAALLLTRNVPRGWTPRLVGIGVLGGLQGAIGWWMVSSGLAPGMLDVASYRLAVHLGLAFSILGLIAWSVYRLSRDEAALLQARRDRDAKLKGMATGLMHLTLVQIVIGALVAGIDAGRSYIDWPLMGGQVVPPGVWDLQPGWRNLFENAGTVQFVHRVVGYLILAFGLGAWLAARRSGNRATRTAFAAMAAMIALQVAWGIATVLYAAVWYLAIVHQAFAVVLLALILRARFLAMYPLPQSVRG